MSRGLSKKFLDKMRQKLEEGRCKGHSYRGWDEKWEGCYFPFLLDRLHKEVDELIIAIHKNNRDSIFEEAADVANFAMFIGDYFTS